MKNRKVYPIIWSWPASTFSLDVYYGYDKNSKEITLTNSKLLNNNVAQLQLNLKHFVAIDEHGKEHTIQTFESPEILVVKGMSNGFFIKTLEEINLPVGVYQTLRFYVENDNNNAVYINGDIEKISELSSVDFKIKNDLVVQKEVAQKFKIWFDLPSFKWTSFFNPFTNLFKRNQKRTPRLVSSF
ncbi:hypothetical protein GCM10011414_25480 [Croceivirga lutea]|uniref:hypothetical protein n=1 Tax=Croceivirga lutea TaxID=1775167 RepID=UPI00163B57B4|nr:hypothetical protein [Croceivirga lutea]GGG54574.1 hypothetical protein GCM10011414_25480 [Croceivirga lutea]